MPNLLLYSTVGYLLILKSKVFIKLNEMEGQKIFEKMHKPTNRESRMVADVQKSRDLRICIHPQALNKALKERISSTSCYR